jgi:hypothetical protein
MCGYTHAVYFFSLFNTKPINFLTVFHYPMCYEAGLLNYNWKAENSFVVTVTQERVVAGTKVVVAFLYNFLH